MKSEKAKGPGYLDLHIRTDVMLGDLVSAFLTGQPAPWPVLSREQVHRVWAEFVRFGVVRNERALDDIFASIRDNVLRLQIATVVAEHEGISRESFLADEDRLTPDQYDAFTSWLVDFEDGWRISDYGLKPLNDAVALAFEARTPEARLKYLDRALHVTHMRGDLSRLFIEGGRDAVLDLDEVTVDHPEFA